ncbi:MAG: hypothetical protein HQL52_14045 [Magnetococcales bacterium]|nr:hypothetical protein [Magnetococcales bacterium]
MPDTPPAEPLMDRARLYQHLNSPWAFVLVMVLLGAWFSWLHQDYPNVRNSLLYSEISLAANAYGPLSQETLERASNKPMGFSILAAPLVQWLGSDPGLKVASVIGTTFYGVVSLLFLIRMVGREEAFSEQVVRLGIILTLFNPLLLYQFVSAYPDTLFAGLFLLALLLADRSLSREASLWHGTGFAGITLASVWIKHHGFVLIPIFIWLLIARRETLQWQWQQHRARFWQGVIPFLLLLIFLLAAHKGLLPTFNMSKNQGNFLSGKDRLEILGDNLENLGLYLSITLGLLTPLLLRRPPRAWRQSWQWPGVVIIFTLPLLFYHGAIYNSRYYLPIAPLLAWWVAGGLARFKPRTQNILLAGFLFCNGFTIVYYDFPEAHQLLQPHLSLPEMDNLRLATEQPREKENLDLIKALAPAHDNTLIFLSRYYWGKAARAWERAGLFPDNLTIHYASSWRASLPRRFHFKRAVIYEYVGTGPERNKLDRDRSIKRYLKKINDRLYLLQPLRRIHLKKAPSPKE